MVGVGASEHIPVTPSECAKLGAQMVNASRQLVELYPDPMPGRSGHHDHGTAPGAAREHSPPARPA